MSENQDHHRLSTEEEDLVHRSAKKIKDNSSSVMDAEDISVKEAPKVSYRDKVMETDSSFELQPEEIVRMVTEELFPDMDISNSNDHGDMEFNPNPNVHVELEEYENWCSPWKYSLIVRLMGKRVGLRFMSMKLKHLWAKNGDVRVMDASEDFFLVKFSDEGDYKHALFEGPWLIADHYLLVQRWRPLFDPLDYTIKKVAVWVEYEGLHLICFECGKYGHRLDSCPEKNKNNLLRLVEKDTNSPQEESNLNQCPAENSILISEEDQNIQSMSKVMQDSNPQEKQTQADGDEVLFGPWMLAKKISRKRPKANAQQGVTNIIIVDGEILQKQTLFLLPEIKDKQKKDDWENEVLAIMSRYNNMRWEAHSKGEFVGDPMSMDKQQFRSIIYGNNTGSGMQKFDSSSNLDRPPDTAKEKGKESVFDGEQGQKHSLDGFSGGVRVEAQGFSGGIWIMWKSEALTVKVVKTTSQCIHLNLFNDNSGYWFLTIVYASPNEQNRYELWEELINFGAELIDPWCVMGDFNTILYEFEKVGGAGGESKSNESLC
ncbi:Zinc finger, CCHC-type [Sesbania bispinosa]|nr:Zinc finger, CCHC-type [Sesbania bispinosa]